MAIGSLLMNTINAQGVFIVAGGVGVVAALYTLTMLPRIAGNTQAVGGLSATIRRLVA